jgi:urea transporter
MALPPFMDSVARGAGQVVFLNSPQSGLAILGSLALGDPYLAGLAAVGTVAATGAAKVLGDKDALASGLCGYNGCLVGCATAVFIAPPALWMSALLTTTIAGAASPFVANALKPAMGSVPQWTLSFNFVTLSMLLRSKPFEGSAPMPPYDGSFLNLAISAPLKGVSQIFVVDSNLTGAALLGSMALYSPGLAAHTVMGASLGAMTGAALGADVAHLAIGLWGFNSALTSLGVGVFFVHSPTTVAVSAGGAVATAALFGAFQQVFGAFDAPCLTLPFCIAMSGCYLMKLPGFKLAKNPHSPEKNE